MDGKYIENKENKQMPGLDDQIHLKMLENAKKNGWYDNEGIYGLHWGDPGKDEKLSYIRREFLMPWVDDKKVCVEIGPGGRKMD